jgi:hypothetical protein
MAKEYQGEVVVIALVAGIFWANVLNGNFGILLEQFLLHWMSNS